MLIGCSENSNPVYITNQAYAVREGILATLLDSLAIHSNGIWSVGLKYSTPGNIYIKNVDLDTARLKHLYDIPDSVIIDFDDYRVWISMESYWCNNYVKFGPSSYLDYRGWKYKITYIP